MGRRIPNGAKDSEYVKNSGWDEELSIRRRIPGRIVDLIMCLFTY